MRKRGRSAAKRLWWAAWAVALLVGLAACSRAARSTEQAASPSPHTTTRAVPSLPRSAAGSVALTPSPVTAAPTPSPAPVALASSPAAAAPAPMPQTAAPIRFPSILTEDTLAAGSRPATEGAPGRIEFVQRFDGSLTWWNQERKQGKSPVANGAAAVPAGHYTHFHPGIETRDAQGVLWMAETCFDKDVSLASESAVQLAGGPPFAAAVKVEGPAGSEKFSLSLADSADHRLTFYKDGKRVDPPKFEILDETGKAVFASSFSYG
ncbi:MAG: hypothetical protein NTW86_04880 [Candidatus Sumerlaeota bacterium]|nr:hypothetical protein [Candidatus Sumerlaeota bacterium]